MIHVLLKRLYLLGEDFDKDVALFKPDTFPLTLTDKSNRMPTFILITAMISKKYFLGGEVPGRCLCRKR